MGCDNFEWKKKKEIQNFRLKIFSFQDIEKFKEWIFL